MRFKELSGKEIVDIKKGARLGLLGQTDLEIDIKSGKIHSFVLPNYKWFGMKKEGNQARIGWDEIKKIGEDMIIIDSKYDD